MPGRNFNSGEYRFGFNGKENDNELMGNGNWQDYGERMYNPRLGRFPSPDPIIIYDQKYPELSPYQFASNTPIQAIDLDGLEAYFIHGTWSDPSTWDPELQNEVGAIFGNTPENTFALQWTGDNDPFARLDAAGEIVKNIIDNRVEGEPITLVGHSHGGNVAIQAANLLMNLGYDPKEINVVTVNTPARSDYQLESDDVNHYNIYTNWDLVQRGGGTDYLFAYPRIGIGKRIYENADDNIEYKDQFPENTPCGISNHCGTARINTNKWVPKLEESVDENIESEGGN